jgi:hypothetical protein
MTLEDDEPDKEDTMSTVAAATVDTTSDPSVPAKRVRNKKRVDANGKPMKRLVLVFVDKDYGHVATAITTRIGPLFTRIYGGEKVASTGLEEEWKAKALAAICEDWISGVEDEEKK